jgi:hypothetical protein
MGCGEDDRPFGGAPAKPADTGHPAGEVDPSTLEPLDPEAAERVCASTSKRYSTLAEDQADFDGLTKRAGKRADFRVSRRALERLTEGRLTLQLATRPFLELNALDSPEVERMAPGIRDLYVLYLADFEVLNGGFGQLWGNHPDIGPELAGAAQRMGLAKHAALFVEAERLRRSGGDTGSIDERFASFQEGCDVSLAVAVAREVRERPQDFLAD